MLIFPQFFRSGRVPGAETADAGIVQTVCLCLRLRRTAAADIITDIIVSRGLTEYAFDFIGA